MHLRAAKGWNWTAISVVLAIVVLGGAQISEYATGKANVETLEEDLDKTKARVTTLERQRNEDRVIMAEILANVKWLRDLKERDITETKRD